MSTALAVAGVTAVLRGLLESWLGDQNANAALGGANADVTAVAPDTIELTGPNATPRLNLFLHQVSQNPGWRNVQQPSVDAAGNRTSSPPLALDLHYLLTAYGPAELQSEVLLGYGMQLLHKIPVLDRTDIEDRLPLPLRSSLLGRQVETIKVTPEPMSSEELSRLWSALQARYRPTAAYHVSVVLIESPTSGQSAQPVLTRGPVDPVSGRETGILVQPGLIPALPTISNVVPPDRQPGAMLGQTVRLEGHHLDGANRAVRIENRLLEIDRSINALAGNVSASVSFAVPNQPAQLPVGIYAISARVQRPGESDMRESNRMALTLIPRITNLPLSVARDAQGDATVVIAFRPQVRNFQVASLILGSRVVPAQPHPTTTDTLTFIDRDAAPGVYLARLRIDGIDSLLIDRMATPPAYLDRRVTIT
jgi:hypothetical protein